jgi:hypothetical protein
VPARVPAVVSAIATSLVVTSCSSATRLAGGPAVGYVKHERPAYGGEALARVAAGGGDTTSFLALEAAARALATERSQVLGFGFGPAWFGTFGRGLVTVDATAMLGAEHFDDRLLALGTLRAGVGGGVTFARSTKYRNSFWGEPFPGGGYTTQISRTVVTLELTGNMDLPFTRAPQYSLGLLVGIARLSQSEYVHGHGVVEPEPAGFGPIIIPATK